MSAASDLLSIRLKNVMNYSNFQRLAGKKRGDVRSTKYFQRLDLRKLTRLLSWKISSSRKPLTEYLEKALSDIYFEFSEYELPDLGNAVRSHQVDYAPVSSGSN